MTTKRTLKVITKGNSKQKDEKKVESTVKPIPKIGKAIAGLIIKEVVNPVLDLVTPHKADREVKRVVRKINKEKQS